MLRELLIGLAFIFCITGYLGAQTSTQQVKSKQKYELRPGSKEFAPVRRGNNYQRIERMKQPVARDKIMRPADEKSKLGEKKNLKHKERMTRKHARREARKKIRR